MVEAAPAAAAVAAPARVQPARAVKTPEYKQRKQALTERTRRTLTKPRKPRKKHVAVNFQKQVIAAMKILGKAAAPTTISKVVSKATGMTIKQVRVHCLTALRGLVSRNLVSALAKNRYSLRKERLAKKAAIKKKAKKIVAAKKAAPAKKKAAAKKKKAVKKPKAKAVADGTPPKRKIAPKKKKAAEPKAKRPKKAAAALEEAAAVKEGGSDGPKWEYFDRVWRSYEKSASDIVEAAYQEYLRDPGMLDVRAVQSGSWRYQVDFVNMQQTNIEHANHTVRNIRRNPPAVSPAAASAPAPESK